MNNKMLGVAIAIASEGFKNKVDKQGEPYILHCLRVMNDLHTRDYELQCIAILHDCIEDKVCTLEELQHKYEFSDRICEAVNLLTHRNFDDYQTYIKRVSINDDARLVKLSDLKDNSNITRLKGLTKADFDRIEKYHLAYTYLSKI